MISLVTVTQGNPEALRRTADNVVKSFGGLLDEVVVGDLSILPLPYTFSDLKMVSLPFNSLFKRGFADVLNEAAGHAKNDLCLYLNVGEIVECNLDLSLISDQHNCYSFNHATDPHIWVRTWNRKELQWSGRIHEVIGGPRRQCPAILFRMADTPKDDPDDLMLRIYTDVKEMVYFQQYVHIAEHPEDLAGTDQHWLKYSIKELDDLKQRLAAKGERYQAFIDGDRDKYLACAIRDKPSKIWSKP